MDALLLCRTGQLAGLVVLVGTATFRLLAGPAAGAGERWLWRGGLAAAGAGALGELWLTAAAMCDRTPWEALSFGTLRTVMFLTHYGHVWVFRAAVWLGLAAWSWRLVRAEASRRQAERPPYKWVAAWTLATLLLASHQGTSHAAVSLQRAWLLPVNALHAVAAGVWPGALPSLACWLAAKRKEADGWKETARVARRFSRLALTAVGVLVLTGLLNSVGLVGTWAALVSGGYGRTLLLKVGIFGGMAGLGAACRRQVPGLSEGDAASAGRALRRGVLAECALAVLVLTATEMLAAGMPSCAACGR